MDLRAILSAGRGALRHLAGGLAVALALGLAAPWATAQTSPPAAPSTEAAPPAAPSAQPAIAESLVAASYRFNPGDVLRVSVWREEGLDRELIVQPDGTVSFPLAGQLTAIGRTAPEVEAALAERLERFIPGPVVTVELIEARGNVAYVLGEVNQPGAFQLARPTTVMQVLSQAGGLTPYAGKGRIRVVRKQDGVESVIPFDYNDVADGSDPAANIELRAGDVVVVPGGSLF